jgi:D-alanyl-D-alanine carboxypeptidase
MKIENSKNKFYILLIVLLISCLVGGLMITITNEVVENSKCKSLLNYYNNLKGDIKPNIKCIDKAIDFNLLANYNNFKANTTILNSFEENNANNKSIMITSLNIINTFLKSKNKSINETPNENNFVETQERYINTIETNQVTLTESKKLKNTIENYLNFLDEKDLEKAKSILALKDYNFLVRYKELEELNKKVEIEILKARNNKNSLTDEEYISTKKNLKNFTAEEFLTIGDNLTTLNNPIWTKGIYNPEVDKIIYELAFKRGYKYRKSANIATLTGSTEQDIDTKANEQINLMIESARKDGANFKLVSGFRDPDLQKIIFTSRLDQTCKKIIFRICSPDDIIKGLANDAINEVLKTSSVPATSKHHTGITFDLNEVGASDLLNFKNTESYKWLSADNYFNAKRFGIIPSYPSGGKNMGPDPEQWEYIYVGFDSLKK